MNRPIELHRYFRELELAVSPAVPERPLLIEPRELVLTHDRANSFICGSTLVTFHPGVAPLHQADALSSLLMAQLAASARAHRCQEPASWYRSYGYHLHCFGWELQELRFREHALTRSPVALDEIIIAVLDTVAPLRDLELVARTWNVLRNLGPADERVALWAACSHCPNRGSFQVAVCQEDAGQPIMHLAGFYLESTAPLTDLRISSFASDNSIFHVTTQQVLLNLDVTAATRQIVMSRLGPALPAFIRDLDR